MRTLLRESLPTIEITESLVQHDMRRFISVELQDVLTIQNAEIKELIHVYLFIPTPLRADPWSTMTRPYMERKREDGNVETGMQYGGIFRTHRVPVFYLRLLQVPTTVRT